MQVAAPLALAEAVVVVVAVVVAVVVVVEGPVAVVVAVVISIVAVLEEKLVALRLFVVPQRTVAELAADEDVAEVPRNLDTAGHLAVELLAEDLAFEGLAACAVAYRVDVVVAYLGRCEDCI